MVFHMSNATAYYVTATYRNRFTKKEGRQTIRTVTATPEEACENIKRLLLRLDVQREVLTTSARECPTVESRVLDLCTTSTCAHQFSRDEQLAATRLVRRGLLSSYPATGCAKRHYTTL